MHNENKQLQLALEYNSLKDTLYVQNALTELARQKNACMNRLREAKSWDEVLLIKGEMRGLEAALCELRPELPEKE